MESNKQTSYAIPVAIIIAGLVVAGAVFTKGGLKTPGAEEKKAPVKSLLPDLSATATGSRDQEVSRLLENVPVPSVADHSIGNPNAKVAIIEYSDIECPYCQRFHKTLQRVMSDNAKDGNLLWVYRQFPLDTHPKAYSEASAAECVAADKGNVSFWQFLNKLIDDNIANSPKYNSAGEVVDPKKDLTIEESINNASLATQVDPVKTLACASKDIYRDKFASWRSEAIRAGLGQNETGTPFSVILVNTSSGIKRIFIDGNQPYEIVGNLIKQALAL